MDFHFQRLGTEDDQRLRGIVDVAGPSSRKSEHHWNWIVQFFFQPFLTPSVGIGMFFASLGMEICGASGHLAMKVNTRYVEIIMA